MILIMEEDEILRTLIMDEDEILMDEDEILNIERDLTSIFLMS